ncbi:stress-activated map kinase interacting protein 1-domain-containing protein [Crepidotus variabilis]|uniref:Stress-activated map kinase interacting protein 1-domain-containing protein n=1 Tax=Crepidotus variabilis TaxID=179855 RepID=A0A9P6E3F8_9AGAR|nr:stress-activated map kinase interacting protein 1-domain-containing protein [Crepidotus variabilis]
MALITDTDFLIHSIRLNYLRDVDDPYGPRVISLDSSYQSNPYIIAAGLADSERWPQLTRPESPNLSEDDQERPLGFPGARLRHTQTIMGGRTGGLGLRVNAKRQSTSKRLSATPRQVKDGSVEDPSEGVGKPNPENDSWIKVEDSEKNASPDPTVQVQQATAPEEQPVAKVVQFIPKFKGAADMEKRRQLRIAARRGAAGHPGRQPPKQTLSFDTSSEEEEEPDAAAASDASEEEEDDYVEPSAIDDLDGGDDFDPVFATSRALTSDSASDGASVFSAGTSSVPTSSGISVPNTNQKSRSRLSPVSEYTGHTHKRQQSANKQDESQHSARQGAQGNSRARSTSNTSTKSSPLHPIDGVFAKKKVQPLKSLKSNLSTVLASSASSSNPFAEMYAAISGRGEIASTNVQIFFPHAKQPRGKPMDLHIRRDATVEEVIGFALWTYWEEGWQPKLDEGLIDEDDPKRGIKLATIGWVLKIAEEDGEVDDDFPSPDRMGKMSKFNSEAYAVLEATATQVQQNQMLESKIQRRPSATAAPKRPEKLNLPLQPMPVPPSGSAIYGSTLGTSLLSSSLGPSSSHGPQIFLRIRVADTADAVHISTTIPVSAGMYMQEALELVCRKRKLANPNDYALLLADMSILIPLDRTVASLQGKRELLLIKRSMLPQMGADIMKGPGKTTDPNASIFNTITDAPEQQYSSTLDYTSAYKKYTIYRKLPMLVARNERTLAIDGVYIHIMPANKAKQVFENGRTISFHIKSIADVIQSNKTSSIFKLILNRGSGTKRYDFEAESPKFAAEIVQTIKGLKAALERTGTINKSRRSRQIL